MRRKTESDKVSVSLSFMEWLELENALYRGVESFRMDKLNATASSARNLMREIDDQIFEQNETREHGKTEVF